VKVAFITNGSNEIGFGHISRTLLLKEHFDKNNIYNKIFIPGTIPFKNICDYAKVSSLREEDLGDLLKNFNIIIIDSVESDFESLFWTKSLNLFIVSITLFLFDAKKRYEHISFFPSIEDSSVSFINKNTKLFKGRKYVAFREEFYKVKYKVKEKPTSIVVTMGGTDPFGLTLKIVQSIIEIKDINFTVLLTKKSSTYKDVKTITKKKKNILVINFTNNIAELFLKNDLAIINGGITRYETCAVGIPFMALSIHDIQYQITEEFIKYGVGVNLGVYSRVENDYIKSQIKDLFYDYKKRLQMSKSMSKLFDSEGSDRILAIIKAEYMAYERDNKMG
jgi:UDP-2,4-diacetamido-2,4,6-trideoxy-beta-L-altropyranose hydrolase